MYELINAVTADPMEQTREVAASFLHAAESDYQVYASLSAIENAGTRPLTFDERNHLADAALAVAHAYDQVAAAWENDHPGLGLGRVQRSEAERLRSQSSLNRVLAVIAPDCPGDDPLSAHDG